MPSYPASWDQDYGAFDPVALTLYKNAYPYMVDYGVTEIDGAPVLDTTNIVPSIAESWTPDEEGRVWTLVLKDGLVFPSGNPLTAEDVKWSKDRAFAAQANVAGIYRLIGLTAPEQVEVVDARTVRFTQEFPSPLSPQIQAICMYVFDSKLAQENAPADDEWATEWMSTTPVGGGRFNVESAEPGQAIVLVANPDFAGTDPALVSAHRDADHRQRRHAAGPARERRHRHRLRPQPPGHHRPQLGRGHHDHLQPEQRARQDRHADDGGAVRRRQRAQGVRLRRCPTSRSSPTSTAATPAGRTARSRSTCPATRATGYPFDTDLDAAAAALAAAGVDGVEAELVYAAGDVEQEQLAILVASAVADAGFTLTPTPLDPATLAERRTAKTIPLQINAGQFWVNDVEYVLSTSLTEGGFLNYAGYVNPEIEQIFADSHTITDEAERLAMWERVQEILAEDVPQAVICQPSFNLPVRSNVSGWVQPRRRTRPSAVPRGRVRR